jgi:formylglycine-generating enzyme required for sulfatase activity
MVGNVWEWVDASVESGQYAHRVLPETGYVTSVDADGIALSSNTSTTQEDELYGKDYFWQNKEGVRGMLRGGFYGSGNDGGIYAVNASVDLGFGSVGVGFRCVREYTE